MLSERCQSVLFVCNVGLLWPNGWMDQDATCFEGRPQPGRQLVSSPAPLPKKGTAAPLLHFSVHVYCGQTAGWIKMPLGMEVYRYRRHCVKWGPSSPTETGTAAFPTFRPMSIVAKWSPISATESPCIYRGPAVAESLRTLPLSLLAQNN